MVFHTLKVFFDSGNLVYNIEIDWVLFVFHKISSLNCDKVTAESTSCHVIMTLLLALLLSHK
jgi:hypothetical protein